MASFLQALSNGVLNMFQTTVYISLSFLFLLQIRRWQAACLIAQVYTTNFSLGRHSFQVLYEEFLLLFVTFTDDLVARFICTVCMRRIQ